MRFQKASIWLLLVVLLACSSLLFAEGKQEGAAGAQAAKPAELPSYSFKWYTAAAPEQPATVISGKICEEILKASNNRIKITLYPGGSLGSERDALDMLRAGSVQFMTTGPSIFNSFHDPIQALTLPYLFKDPEQAYKYFNGPYGQAMFNDIILKKTGIRTLSWRNYGYRVLTTKGISAMKPEDLKGAKIRSMEAPVARFMVSCLGATPVPVSFTELYVALQTGVVQGQENPIANIVAGKFFEVQDYVVLTNHQLLTVQDCVHEPTWQSLSKADQDLILGVLNKYMPESDKAILAYEEKGLKDMQAAGVKIITPDRAAFRAQALDMIKKEYGSKTEWMEIVKQVEGL
jgi:TRAP-type transport system periplasmic protein